MDSSSCSVVEILAFRICRSMAPVGKSRTSRMMLEESQVRKSVDRPDIHLSMATVHTSVLYPQVLRQPANVIVKFSYL